MLFTTPEFFQFFILALAAYWLLAPMRKPVLVAFS